MSKRIIIYITLIFLFVTVACHTGIESTKTIKLSKSEQRELAPTAEDKLMESINIEKLSEWHKGKEFLVADDRIVLVFDPFDIGLPNDSLTGKKIRFEGVSLKPTPGGSDEAVLNFSYNNRRLTYSTGKSSEDAKKSISAMDVPMLIDPEVVADVCKLLTGKRVWTRSQLWYDIDENKITGRKFVPVTIVDIKPGNVVFPLKVYIKDESGREAMMYMNMSNAGIESRTFRNLFSLTNLKDKYPHIRPDVWEVITNGKVMLGMTKEECKLALGNPTDVNAGHDWNATIDLWQYADGTYLRFQDGLLVAFR